MTFNDDQWPTHELTARNANRPIHLENVTCPYCGVALDPETRTVDHVIARRFVPKGALENHWNLIVFACRDCNARKADLEDEISAISMQPDAFGRHAVPDPHYANEARRKALGARSRVTGARVAESRAKKTMDLRFMGGTMTIGMTGPPQVESQRVGNLAKLQMMAIFYFVTFDRLSNTGRFWRGDFHYFDEARRADWGRPTLLGFMRTVVDWEPRFLAFWREGYFNVVMRKHPSADCWSWGLEWNQNFRIVGFFGDSAVVNAVCNELPATQLHSFPLVNGEIVRGRHEESLTAEDDVLFLWGRETATTNAKEQKAGDALREGERQASEEQREPAKAQPCEEPVNNTLAERESSCKRET